MSGPAPLPKGLVPPNFRTARLVGIFNTLFAFEILLCGLCMGGYSVTQFWTMKLLSSFQAIAEKNAALMHENQRASIEQDEKDAKNDQQKIEAAARRLDFERKPKNPFGMGADLSKLAITEPAMIAWIWVELLTGLVLNIALLASGIGLMHWKPWAVRLGIWAALLKILRLVLVHGYAVLVLVPMYSAKIGPVVAEMMQQQGQPVPAFGPDPGLTFTRIYTISYSAFGVSYIICALIYPVLLLWWLTRPGVKSACSGRFRLPKEPNQPC
jgi:hypothetical protein